ncbi:MAG: hypothetical protein AB8E82_07330 [Aureispira sp.]
MEHLLEALIPIVAILCVFGIPLSAIYTSYKLKMEKLRQEADGGSINQEELNDLHQQIGLLRAENDLIKETLLDIQQNIGQTPTRIELTEYEKEQIKLDQENKNYY